MVLPVWQGERFLAEAIESISAQTFPAFELLVIDDGSTDRSPAVALELAGDDPRIIVLHEEHRGIADALNTGVRAARGKYVARMDADDISRPCRLEKQIGFLESHAHCAAVGSAVEVIDAESEPVGVVRFPPRHPEILQALIGGFRRSLAHPSVMMRTDAALAVGGYRAGCFPSEDLDLWLRLIDVGELANLDEPLLRYRRHAGSVRSREGSRQMAMGAAIVNRARARRGLPSLEPRRARHHANADATYHLECVRIALASGNRAAASRHARAFLRLAPGSWLPYVALAAGALPARALTLLGRLYAWTGFLGRPSVSPMR